MKHENITLSFPAELNALLHARVSTRGISKYVAKAVKKALDEDEKRTSMSLEAAYEEAGRDRERLKEIEEWKVLDHLDYNPEWEWNDG